MTEKQHPSQAKATRLETSTPQRRRFGLMVAAMAAAGLSGCVVVPARPVRPRVVVRV